MLGWGAYLLIFINGFFMAEILPAWVFVVLINGLIPLGVLVFFAAAWGHKLRKVVPNKESAPSSDQ
jgi:hypothetical protein